ncbi:MAG TPA: (2Fe-2S) ferredoxin domain-containing protein [Bacteroidales bacterium]|nr:(2Fe-2S) ferredoxin domain-containing protein [Bacteroidales bacterium]
MDPLKKEIVICLGSSCFARGNKSAIKAITEFLKEHNLQNDVNFRGERCFGMCAKGPVLKLGNVYHENADTESIILLLRDYLEIN